MPLPPKRKRCSFGGKEGVWWRPKSADGRSSAGGTFASSPDESFSLPREDKSLAEKDGLFQVEWDDRLARPIYHRSHTSSANQVVSSDDEGTPLAPAASTPEPPNPKRTKATFFQKQTHVRRTKTFGGRSRRPLSLLLSEGDAMSASKDSEGGSNNNTGTRGNASTSNPADQPHGPIIAGLESSTADSAPVHSPSAASGPFDFQVEGDGLLARRARGGAATDRTPQRPTATSSIQQAQDYFAHLDASCQLQLEDSVSPHRPRRSLIRTTRKIRLSSPGFRVEYSKYAKASRELGVSPLVPEEYSKTRREFFRKNVLFDGFVDS